MTTDELRYPIGPFSPATEANPWRRVELIDELADYPRAMREVIDAVGLDRIDTPYRPGGWSVRQMVHHVADANLHFYIRLKLALTEAEPAVPAFAQEPWSELPDARLPVEVSLRTLEAVHERWDVVWRSLIDEQFDRTFRHSQRGLMTIDLLLQFAAWHSRHHLAQIRSVVRQEKLARPGV
jgi:uncharacterized damage-inducible protein DinB